MLKYMLTLWSIAVAAGRRLGRLRFCWIISFGIGARMSLLITFVLVIQLAVHTLKQTGMHLPYPLALVTIDPRAVLPLMLVAVPVLFSIAGWSMFHAQKIAADFFTDFVFETRRANVRMTAPSLLVEPLRTRRKHVQEFAARDEPEMARAARSLIGGITNLIQYIVISLCLLGALAFINWKILIAVFALSAIVVPRYVKSSYIWYLEDKKKSVEIGRTRREEYRAILDGPGVTEADPLLIEEDLLGLLDGETTQSETRQFQERQLSPRRILPFLYGSFGVVVGMLLYETAHMDAAEKAQAVGQFVTTMMLLRFLVGEVAATLSSFRQVNTGYVVAEKICSILRR